MSRLIFLMLIFQCLAQGAAAYSGSPPSDFDASASVSGQEYPFGGLLTGTLGYGRKIWEDNSSSASGAAGSAHDGTGDRTPKGTDDVASGGPIWKYGYIRPAVEWKTSALTNRVTGVFEFFPISILGLSGGGGVDFRNYNKFSGIDCDQYMCDEALTFKFAQAQLIGGVGKFVGVVNARYDWYQAQSADRPFYDYMSYLSGKPGNDDLRSLTIFALYRQSDSWGFGTFASYQNMVFSGSNNGSIFAIASHTTGPWQILFGVGDYQSDHQALRPSALFLLKYTAQKSIGLLR